MPLVHSSSPQAFKKNVPVLMREAKAGTSKHVKSPAQALAIAYAIKRRGRADGGEVIDKSKEFGAVRKANRYGNEDGFLPGTPTAPVVRLPVPGNVFDPEKGYAPGGPVVPPMPPPPAPTGGFGPMGGAPTFGGGLGQPLGASPFGSVMPPMGAMQTGGGVHRQMGGQMPWFAKNEARGLMHTGPIPSIVPGRTDRHNISVASGSYVLPADHVSSLGQGNTQAGFSILHNMFSGAGPLGGGRIAHGAGAPRPPKMMGIPSDRGGARGEETGKPTDVVVAGGEYVIDPQTVTRIGHGNIKHGHQILDHWVKSNREKHIKTLRKLPGPAKS